MINRNSIVKVNDTYSGNLTNVIGKIGRVIGVHTPVDENVQRQFLLDIKGDYRVESSGWPGQFYTYPENAIVNESEVDEFSYDMKDCDGTPLEIGDHVIYSAGRPGIIRGIVKNFKDTEEHRWGNTRQVVKVQLELTKSIGHYDGKDRRFVTEEKYTQWFEHGDRMLITKKVISEQNYPSLRLLRNRNA